MQFGRYNLGRKIATGGMGEVYLASIIGVEGFEKPIALKRIYPHLSLDATYRELFIREAKVSARLVHPNIVQVYDLGQVDGQLFIAMELVEGVDLARILSRLFEKQTTLAVEAAAVVAFDVLEALDFAHTLTGADGATLGLVHRDVSPQNILVTHGSGFVKLCDFGVVRAGAPQDDTLRRAKVGKLRYMAPEQVKHAGLDRRADLFALGAVLFEALTRRPLIAATSEEEWINAFHARPNAQIELERPDLPEAFAAIIDRAVRGDLNERYPTAAAFRDDVERFLETTSPRKARHILRAAAEESGPGFVARHKREPSLDTVRATATRWTALETRIDGEIVGRGKIQPASPLVGTGTLTPQLRRWRTAVGVAVVLGLGGGGVWAVSRRVDRQPEAPAADGDARSAAAGNTDAAPRQSPTSPSAAPSVDAAEQSPVARSAKRRPVARDTKAKQKREVGFININARPWARVSIDGVVLPGTTPVRAHPLAPGRHTLLLTSPTGEKRTLAVTITANETLTKIVDFE